MRILFVICYFAPAWGYGGPPRVIYNLGKSLTERGHEITVYTTDALDANSRIEKEFDVLDGIKVYYFRTISNWLAWHQKMFFPIGMKAKLKETIKEFDIVHLIDARTYPNIYAYNSLIKFKVPYVWSAFGSLPRATGLKKYMKLVYDNLYGFNIFKNTKKALAQTENEANAYKEFGVDKKKIELVPLGIETKDFDVLPAKGLFRKKYSIDQKEKIVLFLGRLHEYKGIELLIKAFAKVVKVMDDVKLVIVGRDDGYLETMNKLINELSLNKQYIFAGPLYDKDRIEAYVDADIFALTPSHFEETSLAALEAAAAGTPVVITKQAEIPYLDTYKGGITINYNVEELEKALMRLLKDDKLREDMGKNARKLIYEVFSWNKVAEQMERIYSEATA